MKDRIFNQYVKEVTSYPVLSQEEEKELAERISLGDETAINKLVKHNLRLVIKISMKTCKNDHQNMMDLIQEGNVGLITAAEKFHIKFKTRFSTYATFWIRQSINRYLGTAVRQIRIPIRKEEMITRANKSILQFQANYGYKPTYEEISKIINEPVESVKQIFACVAQVSSLDAPLAKDSEYSKYEIVKNLDYLPEDALIEKEVGVMVDKILDLLPKLERDILIRRRCLKGYPRKESLYHIGEMFGISAEGVRQIEIRALKKLKTRSTEIKSMATV